tara:strand:- start:122 stop:673 length:552 start_codon:yes stop_codon:yes gene_type:complete
MPDYSKCVIYKITCNDTSITDCYVGSTCNFTRRKSQHKSVCNNSNIPLYKFIRANGGWTNFTMSPIKKFPCDDITDKLIEERRVMELLGATLNKQVPGRSQKESCKNYRQNNKESLNIYSKKYHQDNKLARNIQSKEYNQNNKESLAIKSKVKFNCACGGKYTHANKSIHLKSKKHQNFIHEV